MSKRADEAAIKAYPEKIIEHVEDPGFVVKRDLNRFDRNVYIQGYEQAEKDLALTLEQVVKLDIIIMNMVGEGYNDGYKTRPFYEEAIRRFNSQREKK